MNLVLKPLSDVNDVTWSIVISLVILLLGVGYYIYTIIDLANKEMTDDEMTPPSRKSCYNFRVTKMLGRGYD